MVVFRAGMVAGRGENLKSKITIYELGIAEARKGGGRGIAEGTKRTKETEGTGRFWILESRFWNCGRSAECRLRLAIENRESKIQNFRAVSDG